MACSRHLRPCREWNMEATAADELAIISECHSWFSKSCIYAPMSIGSPSHRRRSLCVGFSVTFREAHRTTHRKSFIWHSNSPLPVASRTALTCFLIAQSKPPLPLPPLYRRSVDSRFPGFCAIFTVSIPHITSGQIPHAGMFLCRAGVLEFSVRCSGNIFIRAMGLRHEGAPSNARTGSST